VEDVLSIEQPSGLGWLPDGSLLAVSMTGHSIWRKAPDGEVTLHADLSEFSRGEANDMVVDANGRAYVGSYGYDLMAGEPPRGATLMRVDPDGTVSAAADGLHFPNGSMITPDGRTLLVNETTAARIAAFTIADDGSLSDHRVWAQIAETPPHTTLEELLPQVELAPDGGCLDADGCVWVGDSLHHRAARVAPGGEVLEEIPAPDDLVFYGCMIGGDDGHTMLLCAAPDWRLEPVEGAKPSVLFTTHVDAGRAGWP
jgi:sugar lactone lactonase YvrE